MAEYRLSDQCFRVMSCAMVLSDARRPSVIDVADWLGGMYLASCDRLSRYWEEPDGFRRLVMGQPEIADSVLELESRGIQSDLAGRGGIFKPFSPSFEKVWVLAQEVATSTRSARPETNPVIMLPEHFLLAMAERSELDLGRRLLASGLRLETLRKEVASG